MMSAAARLLVVGCALVLAACGSTPSRTATTAPAPSAPAAPQAPTAQLPPSPPPPRVVHTLALLSPPGQGAIELVRTVVYTPSVLKAGEFDATASYRAKGVIATTDELAEWRFGYTNTTNLNDTQGGLPNRSQWILSVYGLAISLKNTSASTLEVQWAESVFVDHGGRTRSLIHRGVKPGGRTAPMPPSIIPVGATLNDFAFPADGIAVEGPGRSSGWTAPAFLERLEPGTGFVLTLSVKAFEKTTERTFRFEAR